MATKGFTEFRGIHNNDLLQLTQEQKKFFVKEKVMDLFPEYFVLCVENFNNVAKDSLDEWIYYLKNSEIPDHFTAFGLLEAREQLKYDRLSDEDKKMYDHYVKQRVYEQSCLDSSYYLGHFNGLIDGEESGYKRGEAAGLAKVVIKSHLSGYDMATISAITGLTIDEVASILEHEPDGETE